MSAPEIIDIPGHVGTVLPDQVVCSCGWQSRHYQLGQDAIAEFQGHQAQAAEQAAARAGLDAE